MKNLVELIEKVGFEYDSNGKYIYFILKSKIDEEWIEWASDSIDSKVFPLFRNYNGLVEPEDIQEGRDINMEILRDLTGMDSGYIKTALKVMEDAWLNKFDVISKATGYKITSMEIDLKGGEC